MRRGTGSEGTTT